MASAAVATTTTTTTTRVDVVEGMDMDVNVKVHASESKSKSESTVKSEKLSYDVRVLTNIWKWLCNYVGDPLNLMLKGSFAVHSGAYWSSGLLFLFFEKFVASKSFLQRYKTQPNKSVTAKDLIKLCKNVFQNQLMIAAASWIIRKVRPQFLVDMCTEMVSRPIPTARRIFLEYWFNLACFEVVFYLFHRTLHRKEFYLRIHKIHHQFRSPIALASEYAHPVELILSNVLPGMVGPLLLRSHPLSTWFWLTGSILMTNIHHSGFVFPWYLFNQWTTAHDFHHKEFFYNHGVVGVMDKALGTNGGETYAKWSAGILKRAFGGK